jgi:hypothetical protein
MRVDKILLLVVSTELFFTSLAALAQEFPASGLYQIVSGRYVACCGIAGPISQVLPNDRQRFVRLEVEGGQVTMTFLGTDLVTFSQDVLCPGTSPIRFSFPNGFVAPGSTNIIFHADPGPFPNAQYMSYSVGFSGDRLNILGTAGVTTSFCSDVPNAFTHSNVVAVLMPKTSLSLRISEYQVCWRSYSNRTYQVQYRSSSTSNAWTNLGPLQFGNGETNCLTDAIPPTEPKRSYRLVLIP